MSCVWYPGFCLTVAWQQGVHAFSPALVLKGAPLRGTDLPTAIFPTNPPPSSDLVNGLSQSGSGSNGEKFSFLLQTDKGKGPKKENLGMLC